jgi:raffinose/stachyose/melibiose transport system substrate-binding protein
MKQIIALACILLLCAGLLIYSFVDRAKPEKEPVQPAVATADEPKQTGISEAATEPVATPDEPRQETVRFAFLNDQPVLQLIYDQLSEEFFQQTGIRVVTVSSEVNLEGQAPVLFSVADGSPQWPCYDLSDTVACANLACECFTLSQEDRALGIANDVEPFGMIYNSALLARVGYTGADIDSFSDLRAVATYITQNTQSLGFGAFSPGDEEFMGAVPGNTQALWDLYFDNLAQGDLQSSGAVFQVGTLADMERLSAGGELQLDMLPLYAGVAGEQTQGVHCFVNSYWCVNAEASEEQIQAALAFLNFLISPRMDGTVPVDDLCLLAPYRQAVYARNSVQQRFRNDIALGKNCIVCKP